MSSITNSRLDSYALLPKYQSPTSPSQINRSSIDVDLQHDRSYDKDPRSTRWTLTKRQLLLATIYGCALAAIIVVMTLHRRPAPYNPSYHQWIGTKMATDDPFSRFVPEDPVGPVEMSMWGVHEEGGWDAEGYMLEKGLLGLGEGENRFRLYYNATNEGAIGYFKDLHQFISSMPASIQPQIYTSFFAHLSPDLAKHFDELPSEMRAELGPPSMISYKNIYQTAKTPLHPSSHEADLSRQWQSMNAVDGWKLHFLDDAQAEEWLRSNFGSGAVTDAWDVMRRGILRADFLRYLLVFLQGGVYTDTDTRVHRPIEHWGTNRVEYIDISRTDGNDWLSTMSSSPAIIVGFEFDIPNLTYEWYWPRPMQICQWIITGTPFHPIYLDTIKRVINGSSTIVNSGIVWDEAGKGVNMTSGEEVHREDIVSVMEWTGPSVYTDSVLQYLRSRYRVSWNRLRGIRHPVRVGDVLILPSTAFSPGSPKAGQSWDVQSVLQHECEANFS